MASCSRPASQIPLLALGLRIDFFRFVLQPSSLRRVLALPRAVLPVRSPPDAPLASVRGSLPHFSVSDYHSPPHYFALSFFSV